VLRVSDLGISTDWYIQVLGLLVDSRYEPSPGAGQVVLADPETGLVLCLVSDGTRRQQSFDEHALGLDHLEVLVPEREALDRWVEHLDDVGVQHSGVKEPTYSRSAMVTFRDPDNIQLELFCMRR